MAILYFIGCDQCRETALMLRDGSTCTEWADGAVDEVPPFMEKHLSNGCHDHIRVFPDYDSRVYDYARFQATKGGAR